MEEDQGQYIEIHAKKLFVHEDLVKAELIQLKAKLDGVNEMETMNDEESKRTDLTMEIDTYVDKESAHNTTSTELCEQIDHLEKLLRCLEIEFAPIKSKFEVLSANGEITYNLLCCLFRQDTVVTYEDPDSGLIMGGIVTSTAYVQECRRKYFNVTVGYLHRP